MIREEVSAQLVSDGVSAITAETLERIADAIEAAPRFKWRWVTRARFEVFEVRETAAIAAFKTIAEAERDAKQRTRMAVATAAVQASEDYHKRRGGDSNVTAE
jgi:hypothetical protein